MVVNDETILMVGGNGLAQLLEGRGRGGMGRRAQAEDSARDVLQGYQHIE